MRIKNNLILIIASAILLNFTIPIQSIYGQKQKEANGIVLENVMKYKDVTYEKDNMYSPELQALLSKVDSMKDSGEWALDEMQPKNRKEDGGGIGKMSPVRTKGGLNSISAQYKQSYTTAGSAENKKLGSRVSAYHNASDYKKAIKDNLTTQFDITSPGSILTSEQWKAYVNKMKPVERGDYTVNGKKVNRLTKDMLADVIDDIYRCSADKFRKNGITVNPDFLVAMMINETGWGGNRHSRNKNSWFSVRAYNVQSYKNAESYKSPYEATERVIDLLTKNYLQPGGRYFNDAKGPSMLGASLYYAMHDGGLPSAEWANNAAYHIKRAAKINNVTLPTF